MDGWPILSWDETYVQPELARSTIEVTHSGPELAIMIKQEILECIERALPDFTYEMDVYSERFVNGDQVVEVTVGRDMDNGDNSADDMLRSIVIQSTSSELRDRFLEILQQCVLRVKTLESLPIAAERMKRKLAFKTAVRKVAEAKNLPEELQKKIQTYGGRRRKTVRRKSRSRKTKRNSVKASKTRRYG